MKRDGGSSLDNELVNFKDQVEGILVDGSIIAVKKIKKHKNPL
jgi:hypothetical protein